MREISRGIASIYNSKKVINETANSVLNQSYRNIEMTIIDDEISDDRIRAYHIKSSNIKEGMSQ